MISILVVITMSSETTAVHNYSEMSFVIELPHRGHVRSH